MSEPFFHLDLFSGIGGFSLAAQTVWGSDYHCVGFCEIDPFCQATLRKNFKGVTIYGDIRTLSAERLIADANGDRQQTGGDEVKPALSGQQTLDDGQGCGERLAADTENMFGDGGNSDIGIGDRLKEVSKSGDGRGKELVVDLLTGGFPCQPFSTAGKRKGTEDDRFLWPEMLRVIREVKPRWVIGENVAGIIEMALGQVCSELEELGYEVQCFVIPACAVNAPHRRDRVWIVAHGTGKRPVQCEHEERTRYEEGLSEGHRGTDCEIPSSDTSGAGLGGRGWNGCGQTDARPGQGDRVFPDWSRDWREVAFESCVHRMDDGLPGRVAGLPNGVKGGYRTVPGGEEGQILISESKWRQSALKAYGNAIVPQVAMEIMRAIKAIDHE